jgi:hypothetical protein
VRAGAAAGWAAATPALGTHCRQGEDVRAEDMEEGRCVNISVYVYVDGICMLLQGDANAMGDGTWVAHTVLVQHVRQLQCTDEHCTRKARWKALLMAICCMSCRQPRSGKHESARNILVSVYLIDNSKANMCLWYLWSPICTTQARHSV